jgi:D-alanine-D-alanine ligase
VLWNAVGEDPYAKFAEPQPLPWNPTETAADIGTDADEIDAIIEALQARGYTVKGVNLAESFDTLLGALRSFKPDAVFNLVEWFNDLPVQEAYIAGLFSLMGIQYTGATPGCLLTCQRKFRTKVLLEAQGVPTPEYTLIREMPIPQDVDAQYPVIVKPAREDASGGIDRDAVCHEHAELELQVAKVLAQYKQPALIERYIEGREIHVAILGNDPPEVLPLLEMEFDESEGDEWRPKILTYEAKWDPLSPDFYALDVQVPAKGLPRQLGNRIREVALQAYKITECRDYARVDIRVEEDGEAYVLEVNPNPNLAEGTGFMLCAEKSGRTFEGTIDEIVRMALARRPVPPPPEAKPDATAKAKPEARTKPKPEAKATSKARAKRGNARSSAVSRSRG